MARLRHLFLLTVIWGVAGPFARAQTVRGIHPRASAADYAASEQTKNATYAAAIVPASQVKHLFAVDISKTYTVIELACYPSQAGAATVDPTDFVVKILKNSEFVHPVDPVTVAAVMQDKNTPRPPSARNPDVYTEAGVGYESGTDPVTGRRVHGTYTEAGVGMGTGRDGGPYPYPAPPPAGATPQDRAMLEQQLAEKALPGGSFSVPVAGFLYFPANSLKKSSGSYELEYLGDASGKMTLRLPAKER